MKLGEIQNGAPTTDRQRADYGPAALEAVRPLEARAERVETVLEGRRTVWRRWGKGAPVVLLHGGAGSWTHWLRTIPALEGEFTLLIPDIPGYGESDALPAPVPFARMGAALVHGIEQLARGSDKICVVGFSMGSSYAMHVARSIPQRVRRLVIVGAGLVDDPPRRPKPLDLRKWNKAATRVARRDALRHNLQVMMIENPANIDALAFELYAADVVRARLRPGDVHDRPASLADQLALLLPHIQVDGISGRDDQLFRHILPRQAESLARLRPGAKFHFVEDCGHWVMYEGAPAFNQTLLGILR